MKKQHDLAHGIWCTFLMHSKVEGKAVKVKWFCHSITYEESVIIYLNLKNIIVKNIFYGLWKGVKILKRHEKFLIIFSAP